MSARFLLDAITQQAIRQAIDWVKAQPSYPAPRPWLRPKKGRSKSV